MAKTSPKVRYSRIRSKAPATYMGEFKKDNPRLRATMTTHLIDVGRSGIWENDYDKFFWKRCQAISAELEKRVIHREVDDRGQEVHTDDFEDEELQAS